MSCPTNLHGATGLAAPHNVYVLVLQANVLTGQVGKLQISVTKHCHQNSQQNIQQTKNMASIILSRKNKPMLTVGGFMYFQHSRNKKGDRQYWRCHERDRCNARSTTPADDFTRVLRDGTNNHTHPASNPEIKAREIVQSIKRHATEHPNEPPKKIISTEIGSEDNDEVLSHIPERENMRSLVNKTQNRNRPQNPNNLTELKITERYDVTSKNEKY